MRTSAPIGIGLAVAMVLAGCGGSGPSRDTQGPEAARPVRDSARPPGVVLPPGPAPKKLVVHDIRKGTGRAIPPKLGVSALTNYVAYSYKTRKPFEVKWEPTGAFHIGLSPGKEVKGWEEGLVGMKAGGRRELRVPSKLAYGQGALLYVIDLLAIEFPPPEGSSNP